MVSALKGSTSSLQRLSINMREWIDENIDKLIFRPDVDIDSNNVPWGPRDRDPIYNFRIQLLPEVRRLPADSLRMNLFYAINRTFGSDSHGQYESLMKTSDQVHKLLMERKSSSVFGSRDMRIINSSVNQRGKSDTLIVLSQIEFKAFRRHGEI